MRTEFSKFGPDLHGPASILGAGPGQAPLFHAAWLFAVGITAAYWQWVSPSRVLVALTLTAMICGLAAYRAQRVVWIPLGVLWILLGMWCAEMEPQPAPAPDLAALSDGLLRTVEGTIIDAGPVRTETEEDLDSKNATVPGLRTAQRIDLRVSSVEVVSDDEDVQSETTGGVRLTVRLPVGAHFDTGRKQFHCGERVRAVARLLIPETYHDPGVWSREDFLLNQGITSTATTNFGEVEDLGNSDGFNFACRLSEWQHESSARILALPLAMNALPAVSRLSANDAAMLAAMITGDRTYLTHSLRVGFERTGSFHMLVVSGFHLAIVAACIFWLTQRMRLARFPATLATIAGSFGYAFFTGFATPVQRSLWMVTVFLIARLFYRERSPLNAIGFAALCLLVFSPRSLFEAGLQMTLLAVVSIGGIAAPLLENTIHPYVRSTHGLRLIATDVKRPTEQAQFRETLRMFAEAFEGTRLERMAWRAVPFAVRSLLRLAELVVVSAVVELAMTLPMALYFHRLTLFALPVNLFILPLLMVLMPAALVTLLTAMVWPSAAAIPAVFVAVPLHGGLWLVHLFGSMALGDFRIPTPLMVQSACFCALLAAAIVLAREACWQRGAALGALTLAALVAVAPPPVRHPRHALLLEAIDVGQGDSLLVITADGKSLLVDGGGFGGGLHEAPQDFDIGEEVVSEALWSRGIRRLDAVALTHAHSDHMGGLPAVLRNFRPLEFWVGNNPRFGAYDALLNEAGELGVSVRSLRAGDRLELGDAQIAVLAPFRDYQPGPEPSNNDSLVLHLAYGATSLMLEGDAEAPIEHAMLGEAGLESTILKVGHHGSLTSTRPDFLARVAPRWAVISCGLRNRYGHPRPEVLEALQVAKVRTFSTDINGATCFRVNGKSVDLEPFCGWERQP